MCGTRVQVGQGWRAGPGGEIKARLAGGSRRKVRAPRVWGRFPPGHNECACSSPPPLQTTRNSRFPLFSGEFDTLANCCDPEWLPRPSAPPCALLCVCVHACVCVCTPVCVRVCTRVVNSPNTRHTALAIYCIILTDIAVTTSDQRSRDNR